ncbi:hypothetical protein B0H11DRAFT_1987477 [Mycena galericulata]|nr:hypothetical protein B0H11DRAFT_1987477 [Mycena galericulata]
MSLWAALRSSMPSTSFKTASTLYRYDTAKQLWSLSTSADSEAAIISSDSPFSLITWNVDFAAPLVIRRFQSALSRLEQLLSPHLHSESPPPQPTIILFQEVHSSCFQPLLANAFIRESYQLTNISSRRSYSTVTLVPKSLSGLVSSVARVPFTETRMQRDCLSEPKKMRFRIANTHLESLSGFGDRARPKQLGVDGGLVAGDMNAISASDVHLPEQVGLSDAWLVSQKNADPDDGADVEGTSTGASEGHTWGYQPRCEYPPRRLDKILTAGKMGAVEIQRVGVGLKVDGRDAWVSDHYGLSTKIIMKS